MSDNPYKVAADFLLRTLTESALPRLDDGREIFHAAITSVLEDEAIVEFTIAGGKLAIIVGDYWRYPTACYFVNWTHASNGNFRCGAGVNNVWAALVEIGSAMEFARNAGDKQEAPQQTPV